MNKILILLLTISASLHANDEFIDFQNLKYNLMIPYASLKLNHFEIVYRKGNGTGEVIYRTKNINELVAYIKKHKKINHLHIGKLESINQDYFSRRCETIKNELKGIARITYYTENKETPPPPPPPPPKQ
ncbi:hypothetical protein LNTAR_24918 [Lentisphaera araneosa HTCC2155]|uniref:Uncharacterized protein n=1 Tax=Lentisphaera araneosa HTCC2155 TaxID=313628 RepID=A6DSZ1_9BACT|nr:hypothetical protein [Lentisphaera araneosa]EDM25281.1 hypothetical protein LNTAR_24918 [Lentisphaera araneosa HTCC2155]